MYYLSGPYLTLDLDFSQLMDSTPEQYENNLIRMTQPSLFHDREPNDCFIYPQESESISAAAFTSAGDSSHSTNHHQMSQQEIDHIWTTSSLPHRSLDQDYTTVPHSEDTLQINPLISPHLAPPMPQQELASQVHSSQNANTFGRLIFIVKPDSLGNFQLWSPEERQDNRRIISFSRQIIRDIIYIDCRPISSNEYQQDMLTISCIYWAPNPQGEIQHKLAGECIFTSVDIIILLEKLVAHTFTVKEKNRIRRNLEGYKPETVKKNGTTNQFFNQLMAYTSPRTRNIEKDIKVFLWDNITKALKKIVQKYQVDGGIEIGEPMAEHSLS
jgi:hypothetical protein